jgi:hypothetical protein
MLNIKPLLAIWLMRGVSAEVKINSTLMRKVRKSVEKNKNSSKPAKSKDPTGVMVISHPTHSKSKDPTASRVNTQ